MGNKINILFVMIQMEMGGSERLVHTLAKNIDRNLFNPSIAWFFGDRILKDFRDLDVPLYHIPKVKRFDFSAMQGLSGIIRDNNIHVVNAHHFMSMVYAFYGCKIKNKTKLVYTEHSEWEVEQISWMWSKIGGYLLAHSDAAVGVNENVTIAMKKSLNLGDSKAHTIRNGVDLNAFASRYDKDAKKISVGLSKDDKVIGIVANFKKIKNHYLLLRVFNDLLKEHKNVKLLLIGQGFAGEDNTEQELRNYVMEEGIDKDVLFLGYRPDIPELLNAMDIFCLTSFKEGLPISLIEAMAASLPLVGTDTTGIREVIIPGKNGFLVPINEPDKMKETLCLLLKDESLRCKLGRESRLLANNRYSSKLCVESYQNLFAV